MTNGQTDESRGPSGRGVASPVVQGPVAIQVDGLTRTYAMGGQDIPALRGVNMQVPAGRFMALKGRSGSGKTTLLNCIGGLDRPTSGTVSIFGELIEDWSERKLTMWRRQTVGFVFQSFGLMPSLSAYENVELMLRMSGVRGRERRRYAVHCLDLVGLTKWMHHRPFELSGGQQQRVAIARSLANSPRLILADEPTGELDSQTAREILSLFQTIVREQNVTLLMVTHDSLADEYVDEILYLRDGIIADSSAEPLPVKEGSDRENHVAVDPTGPVPGAGVEMSGSSPSTDVLSAQQGPQPDALQPPQ